MILLELFNNISEYTGKPINFSEYQVDSLFYLEFEDSGLELKNIIETVYTDGIDGFEDVENDGTKITGVFIDKVSSGLTKRFRFTVTEDNISYKLLNPEDLDDADFTELDFATTPTGKKKKCVKGQACGNTCISKTAACKDETSPVVKKKIKGLLAKDTTPSKKSSKPKVEVSKVESIKATTEKSARKKLEEKIKEATAKGEPVDDIDTFFDAIIDAAVKDAEVVGTRKSIEYTQKDIETRAKQEIKRPKTTYDDIRTDQSLRPGGSKYLQAQKRQKSNAAKVRKKIEEVVDSETIKKSRAKC